MDPLDDFDVNQKPAEIRIDQTDGSKRAQQLAIVGIVVGLAAIAALVVWLLPSRRAGEPATSTKAQPVTGTERGPLGPGAAFEALRTEYVVPDVYARRTPQGWIVELNPSALPRVRLNESYAGMITRAPGHAVLRTQLQEARWLLRSLEIRNETMLKVARTIVERQQAFLDRGEESMEPMILRDVAEAIGMHESTISRVTTHSRVFF